SCRSFTRPFARTSRCTRSNCLRRRPSSNNSPGARTMAEETLSRRSMTVGAAVIVVALLLLLLAGLLPRRSQRKVLAERAHASATNDALPLVSVVKVNRAPANADLTLPGTLQPIHDASVYARSSGYVRAWYADIGAKVHAGELLAEIDAPDLDQQL